ncbi:aldo/keto reductase [Psittacicella gerlachiana]|uniref:2,5-diketo-D-gluconic acid reductase n=1 Tax=Psittacicella gerlachiana TaxID=2028574 RepID=A0A3A1YAX9_9GAMM|nr:aldo/keto reductase [Psittacicella gerlachiana]RIY34691.1 2,5-diketo-D-gluconic acid reductase [Psittacicella gerlachiana]
MTTNNYPYVTLNNGVKMPQLGFGVFQITDPEQCEQAVLEALQAGYRLIDTAQAYYNEEAVGRAIKRSGIPREEIFITTKLWISDAKEGQAYQAFTESARKLGVDYIDLYLIHQPVGDVFGAWRDLEKLYAEGKVKALGISNFAPDQVMNLMLFNKVKPAVNQIEMHPFFQREEVKQFLEENDIVTESWASFAEGRNHIFTNPVLEQIAKAHNKSVAQVILRWLLQRGVVVIPKSVTPSRIQENFNVFDFSLTEEQMAQIKELDTNTSLFFDHRTPEVVKFLAEYK